MKLNTCNKFHNKQKPKTQKRFFKKSKTCVFRTIFQPWRQHVPVVPLDGGKSWGLAAKEPHELGLDSTLVSQKRHLRHFQL